MAGTADSALGDLADAAARHHGVALTASARERLVAYTELVTKWNRRIRLVGSRDAAGLLRDHVSDALALVPHISADCARALDVGTGAGLPAIVLAVVCPHIDWVALEPIRKKHAFLLAARRELSLDNLFPEAERLDTHAARLVGGYDLAVSRATFPLLAWLERAQSVVRADGLIVGLEGAARVELPPGATRHPYRPAFGSGTRAVISTRRNVPRGTSKNRLEE